MALIATYSPAIVRLPLMDLCGSQIQMTSYQFAELISRHEVWRLCKRDYRTGRFFYPFDLDSNKLTGILICHKMTKVHKELMALESINDKWEYALTIGYPGSEEDWVNTTFVRDGNDFLVEFH